MDCSVADADLQDMRLKAASFAFRAAQVQVAKKLHLDLFEADAGAAFTAAITRVEGKR
jgi:hypothetical protein